MKDLDMAERTSQGVVQEKENASYVGGAGVRLEEARHAESVLLLLVHPQVQRLHSSEEQPRVERAETSPLRVLEEVDLQAQGRWSAS